MQLHADAVDTDEELAMVPWWEWEHARENRRELTWSTGSRDLHKVAGLGAEATDEDVAAEELDADTHLGLTVDAWEAVDRARLGP